MATQAASPAPRPLARPRARWFYRGMAVFAAAVVVFGFARTYYLKELFGTPPLPGLLHLHGAVMTAWLALLIVQSTLVQTRRVDIHRKLGVAGGFLAAAIVVIGPMVAIRSARLGHTPAPQIPPLAFMVVPFGDIFVFTILIGAALYYRRRPELHKRLMLVGTLAIMGAGVARWPITAYVPMSPLIYFGIPDLALIGCIVYDYARTRRLSPAWVWGGLLVIASHPLRLIFSGTAAWMSFAHWITGV